MRPGIPPPPEILKLSIVIIVVPSISPIQFYMLLGISMCHQNVVWKVCPSISPGRSGVGGGRVRIIEWFDSLRYHIAGMFCGAKFSQNYDPLYCLPPPLSPFLPFSSCLKWRMYECLCNILPCMHDIVPVLVHSRSFR